ncbi:MAG TPA: hypothetical protein VM487_18590 [Phycisphaerae bacterium]|nr:hypothetical protein [Phycisphaerae bacterium]
MTTYEEYLAHFLRGSYGPLRIVWHQFLESIDWGAVGIVAGCVIFAAFMTWVFWR